MCQLLSDVVSERQGITSSGTGMRIFDYFAQNPGYTPWENACDTRRSMLAVNRVIQEMSFFDHHPREANNMMSFSGIPRS